MASILPFRKRAASSSSPKTGRPKILTTASSGVSSGTPGLTTIRSWRRKVSRPWPPASTMMPSSSRAGIALQSTFGEAAKMGVGTIDPKHWKPSLNFDPAKGIQGYNQQFREPVRILMGLVLLVLLIACTNVALLIMARNEARRREFSLRMAIGAERAHLFRQLLTESSLLVIAGAGLGWAFAVFATRALADWSGIETGLDPDRNVLFFTLAISVISALAFSVAPLWVALRIPVSGVLRATATNITQDRRRALGGRVLMASQVAICLLLLIAAGLLIRTLRNYETQDLGMRADGLLVFGITPQRAFRDPESRSFEERR